MVRIRRRQSSSSRPWIPLAHWIPLPFLIYLQAQWIYLWKKKLDLLHFLIRWQLAIPLWSTGVKTQRHPHWVPPFSLPTPPPSPPLFSSEANSVPSTEAVKIRLKTMITPSSSWKRAKELALANQYHGHHVTLSCNEGISERIARSNEFRNH